MDDKRGRSITQTIRMTEDVQAELKELIDNYEEGTIGDLMELMIKSYKANSGVSGAMESDMRELNSLTARIYSLYENISQRNDVAASNLRQEYNSKITEAENKVMEIRGVVKLNEDKLNALEAKLERQISENSKLNRENIRLKEMESKNDTIIEQLKEKSADMQEIKTELSNTKTMYDGLDSEHNRLIAQYEKLERDFVRAEKNSDELRKEIEKLEATHQSEIKRVVKEKELENSNLKRSLELDFEHKSLELENSYRQIINEKDDEILKLKNEIADIIRKFTENSNSLMVENSQLKDKIRELQDVRVASEELRNSQL